MTSIKKPKAKQIYSLTKQKQLKRLMPKLLEVLNDYNFDSAGYNKNDLAKEVLRKVEALND